MSKRKNRKYSEEYKQEAVELAKKLGVSEASRKLEIPLNNLQGWKSGKSSYSIEKSQDIVKLQSEVKRLKKELAKEKAIVEILKKATAFFSKEGEK